MGQVGWSAVPRARSFMDMGLGASVIEPTDCPTPSPWLSPALVAGSKERYPGTRSRASTRVSHAGRIPTTSELPCLREGPLSQGRHGTGLPMLAYMVSEEKIRTTRRLNLLVRFLLATVALFVESAVCGLIVLPPHETPAFSER